MFRSSLARQRALVMSIISAVAFGVISYVGAVAAADPVQASRDLKAMGVEYTGQDFAKAAGSGDMAAVQLFLDARMDVNTGDGAAIGLAAGRVKPRWCNFYCSRGPKRPPMPCSTRAHGGIKT